MFEFDRFADRIHFYAPRDRAGSSISSTPWWDGSSLRNERESNVARYVADFDRFVREALGRS